MSDTEVEGSDLGAIVADELRQAQTFDQTKRTLALQYMRGEMTDTPARVNGSSQTDRTLATNIQWILPGVVRVFTASDQMVEFEATQEGGEQGAEEASEYTNYSFFRENDGYRILYNGTYDGLLLGNGAASSYWCPEESKTKLFKDKTLEELAVLLEEGWQGLGMAPQPTGIDSETGEPTFTVRLKMVAARGQIKDATLKPENLELSGDATTIDDARMVSYLHDDWTRSDLMEKADEYGWDKSIIENFPAYSGVPVNSVDDARRGKDAFSPSLSQSAVKSGDRMNPREIYIRADKDGDGIAELLQVWYLGDPGAGVVLSDDEWEDDVPFTDIPCYPVPHSWAAEGLYDRSADIQRVNTVLLRGLLDNSYATAMPMQEVEEGSVLNPDILVNKKFGGLIWKKKGSAPIVPHETPFIGDKLLLALTYMNEQNAKRTGITKTTMALDPEALQNQTATSSQLQHDAGYSQIELIARNMAELGWSKFFAKRRNLAKKYIKEAVKIPSRNGDVQEGQDGAPGETSKYRTVQPEQWSDNMACTINVGLGTGSRDRDMAMLNTILNGQVNMADRLANFGLKAKAIEFIPKIRKTAVEMAESSGLKNPDDYYPDISDDELKAMIEQANQPQPDPALALEQAKGQVQIQLKQADVQAQMQIEQGRQATQQQLNELESQRQVNQEAAQLQADLTTKEADRQNALVIAAQNNAHDAAKQDKELQFRAIELATKTQLERDKMENAVKVAAAKPAPKPAANA